MIQTPEKGGGKKVKFIFQCLARPQCFFTLSDETEYDILGRTQFFNKSVAFTITGHSTTDLFHWSKRLMTKKICGLHG